MRRSHVIYTQKSPAKKLKQRRKRPHRRSSAFDHNEVTARGSAGYPCVRHSAQKSPKGAAGLAQQVRNIEVFLTRLSMQKSPKGAAGLAQQVRNIEVFLTRLSMQKSPKGAAGLAQQVRKTEVFFRRLSMQKSPKGAAELAQQVRKIEVFFKRISVQKSPKGAAGPPCKNRLRVQPDQHNKHARSSAQTSTGAAGSAKAQSLIIQIRVTYMQRGHHTLHRFNLRDDTHLPIVEQHYPQFIALKQTSQLSLTYTRPSR
jgi:hypothetical protein